MKKKLKKIVSYLHSLYSENSEPDFNYKDFSPIDPNEEIRKIFRSLISMLYVITGIFGGIAMISLIIAKKQRDFKFGLISSVVGYGLIMLILHFRKKISVKIITSSIFFITLFISIVKITNLGLISTAPLMMSSVCAISALFLGIRYGILFVAINILTYAIIGFLIITNRIDIVTDFSNYQNNFKFWITRISDFLLFSLSLLITVEMVMNNLKKSIILLNNQAKKLSESEEQYKLLTDNISDLFFILDLKLNLTYISPSVKKIFGYTEKEAFALDYKKLFVENDSKMAFDILKEKLKNNEIIKKRSNLRECQYIKKDGSTFWGESKTELLCDENGKPYALVGTLRDCTERKKIEKEKEELQLRLKQSEKMQIIGQLAGGIAHDFNNHLVGIMGSAEHIKYLSKNNPQINESSQNIITASQRASDLVKKLLIFSKKDIPKKENIDINAIINDTITIAKHSINPNITIKKDLKYNLPLTVGDTSQIENAILNLAINSRDAMPDGGKITFKTSETTLSEKYCNSQKEFNLNPGNYIKIIVTDTGTGISNDTLKHIFEPFFTTKTEGKGTGIGLATVHETVLAHKGAILVDSVVNEGTTFTIYLPVLNENKIIDTAENIITKKTTIKKLNIMIIDDDNTVGITASKLLEVLKHNPQYYSDVNDALDAYQKNPDFFDIVMIDMLMPQMNGKDVFKKLQTLKKDVRVILTSGYTVDNMEKAIDGGVKYFLHKPYSIKELKTAINKTIFE